MSRMRLSALRTGKASDMVVVRVETTRTSLEDVVRLAAELSDKSFKKLCRSPFVRFRSVRSSSFGTEPSKFGCSRSSFASPALVGCHVLCQSCLLLATAMHVLVQQAWILAPTFSVTRSFAELDSMVWASV